MNQITRDNIDQWSGKPIHFNLENYKQTITELCLSDDIIKALDLCDNPPSFYKDHPELIECKRKIYSQLWSIFDYAQDNEESIDHTDEWFESNRIGVKTKYNLVLSKIQEIQASGFNAHIKDVCPGNYWLLKLLHRNGVDFSYQPYTINKEAKKNNIQLLIEHEIPKENSKTIFINFETIEHLWSPKRELEHFYYKYGYNSDVVLISTPLNTFGGGNTHTTEDNFGHLRTFNTQDVMSVLSGLPKIYRWGVVNSPCQILVGDRIS